MNYRWGKDDIFVADSLRNGKLNTSKRQIVIGKIIGFDGIHYHFIPLFWNKEWGTHNYYGTDHSHNMHEESPMFLELKKITEEQIETVRTVLL